MKATLRLEVVAISTDDNCSHSRGKKHFFDLDGNNEEIRIQIDSAVESLNKEKQEANEPGEWVDAYVIGVIEDVTDPIEGFILNQQFDCE